MYHEKWSIADLNMLSLKTAKLRYYKLRYGKMLPLEANTALKKKKKSCHETYEIICSALTVGKMEFNNGLLDLLVEISCFVSS